MLAMLKFLFLELVLVRKLLLTRKQSTARIKLWRIVYAVYVYGTLGFLGLRWGFVDNRHRRRRRR
jgi:hypothetical protein